jgi:putative redox protein
VQVKCVWTGKMGFSTEIGEHQIKMDASRPIGEGTAPTPKELVLAGLCGCTAMDVAALLKKHRQEVKSFFIEAETDLTKGHPSIFEEVHLRYVLEGPIEPTKLIESVQLSQSKYCGVSAMIVKAAPIKYSINLNGETINESESKFE